MTKYAPLHDYLTSLADDPVEMSFREIERLGIELPMSARTYDAWWLDNSEGSSHSHARAWRNDRRSVVRVDRNQQRVWFSRRRRSA